jgi:hypothetical protein
MIHKFSFAGGKVGYANRYVRRTAFVENERAGRITAQTFATDPCQELFRKGFVPYHAGRLAKLGRDRRSCMARYRDIVRGT